MSTSDVPGGIPGGMPGQEQVSEEEMRQYLGQMRATPADAVLAEVIQSLLSVTQVKLGRKDGRLLLDVLSAVADTARDRLDPNLVQQVDDALSQLRVAQVEAEGEVTKAAMEGHVEHNDLDDLGRARERAQAEAQTGDDAADDDAPAPQQPAPPQEPQRSAGSRLWTPGG